MWPGAAMNTGFELDSGYHEEWYGNFYSYAAKFHNGEWIGGDMNGATNIDGQWGKAHRFKPAANGSMHDPDDKLAAKDPRITPFDDAKCIVNTGWGWTVVDKDGYVYHNQFAIQGSLASHYNHRAEGTSGSPMTAPAGQFAPHDLQGGDPIAYVPPGDHLRPMVKKSAVDGTMQYVKITAPTCQEVENRIAAYYSSGDGVYLDDDGYAYVSGILLDREYETQLRLKDLYPDDVRHVAVDNAVGDAHARSARVDLPRGEYDELFSHHALYEDTPYRTEYERAVSPYTGNVEYTQSTPWRNGGWVSPLDDVTSVPAAYETAHFEDVDVTQAEEGKTLSVPVFHALAGPNYALPLKLTRDGSGTPSPVLASQIASVVPIRGRDWVSEEDRSQYNAKTILFFLKDGSAKAWFLQKTLDLQSVSLNGDRAAVPVPANAPQIAYEWREKTQYMPTNYVRHTKFEMHCSALPASICELPTPCDSAICDRPSVPPTTPPPAFSRATVNHLVLNVTGAKALTIRAADFPKLRKLVLVGAEHTLASLTLDKVLLASLDMDISPRLSLHASSAGTGVSRVYVGGNGTVPLEWLNSLDNAPDAGGLHAHATEVSALLPKGTPLSKGALRDVELGDAVTVQGGGLHNLSLPQLWRLKVGSALADASDLRQLLDACPKLVRLVLPSTPLSMLTSLHSLGAVGAHLSGSLSRLSTDGTFPSRIVEAAPAPDLDAALAHLSSAQAHVRYLRVTDPAARGDAASLAAHAPHLKSVDLAGLPGVTGTLPSLPKLETLYLSDSLVTVLLSELGRHGRIMTVHVANNPRAIGVLHDLRSASKLHVLNARNATRVAGSLADLFSDVGPAPAGCGVEALCPTAPASCGALCAHAHQLRFLDVSLTRVTGPLSSLSHEAHLAYFAAEGAEGVTGSTSDLSHLDKLTYLHVGTFVTPSVDADISSTGGWVGQYGYGTTCASYRATDISYGFPDPCGQTVAQLSASWLNFGGSFTPPAGFTASSKFEDFCMATCGKTAEEQSLLPGVVAPSSMDNACGSITVVPALPAGSARRLATSSSSDADRAEFEKAHAEIPHHRK